METCARGRDSHISALLASIGQTAEKTMSIENPYRSHKAESRLTPSRRDYQEIAWSEGESAGRANAASAICEWLRSEQSFAPGVELVADEIERRFGGGGTKT